MTARQTESFDVVDKDLIDRFTIAIFGSNPMKGVSRGLAATNDLYGLGMDGEGRVDVSAPPTEYRQKEEYVHDGWQPRIAKDPTDRGQVCEALVSCVVPFNDGLAAR